MHSQHITTEQPYDILICGAGLIGASLALALAPLPLRIGVIEASPLKTTVDLRQDGRSLALNYGSVNVLTALQVWPQLAATASAIKTVHVSERGRFGKLRFTAAAEQVAALGYVVPAPLLSVALAKKLFATPTLRLLNPAKVTALTRQELLLKNCAKPKSQYTVTVQTALGEQQLSARLVIAADGANSALRELVGIPSRIKCSGQSALATRIMTQLPLNNIAYERFIPGGAVALLPLTANNAALILTGTQDFIAELARLDDAAFLLQVQTYFGRRLGRFLQTEIRHVYPLVNTSVEEQVSANFVLLGNAAHTLHPIAAQGFNLGLQDVALLSELLATAVATATDFTELNFLQQYAKQRQQAQRRIMQFTQRLVTVFAQDFFPVTLARSVGLKLLDLIPPVKHRLAAQLMGVAGNSSSLSRGIPSQANEVVDNNPTAG